MRLGPKEGALLSMMDLGFGLRSVRTLNRRGQSTQIRPQAVTATVLSWNG
jgi:hypothetical protein